MKRFLLDTSAQLTLRDGEPGADRVEEVLRLASENRARCHGCFMSLMELM
jgi:PIN domain nuclease of toxin-antitoxin system